MMMGERMAWYERGHLADDVVWLVFLPPVIGGWVDIAAKIQVLCWEWVQQKDPHSHSVLPDQDMYQNSPVNSHGSGSRRPQVVTT